MMNFLFSVQSNRHVVVAIFVISAAAILVVNISLVALFRIVSIISRPPPNIKRPEPSKTNPTHLLVVLGSGGHTTEILNILSSIQNLDKLFTRRTYLVSSGDGFSAFKAKQFEETIDDSKSSRFSVVTVRRARRVHQSFLTAPFTALLSLWDCLKVLCGTHHELQYENHIYPDLILTNGPGTGVCVILASILLLFFGYGGPLKKSTYPEQGRMRTIFIESWARVRTLSLSGKILKPLVGRFIVQWPQLAELQGEGVEYIGALVT